MYFKGLDEKINRFKEVRTRFWVQRPDEKNMEIDGAAISIIAHSDENQTLLVEVKKTQTPIGKPEIEKFLEKTQVFASIQPDRKILSAFWSFSGFSPEAEKFCQDHNIGLAIEPSVEG